MTKKKGIIIAAAVAVVLAGVLLALIFAPKGGKKAAKKAATIDEGIDMSVSVDENGIHQAQINTGKNGEIENNSYGTLMEYYPANIREIHVENRKGTFDVTSQTPEGQATQYTIKGYEDLELQAGNPDLIATAAASLKFSQVATLDKEKGNSEFGFDNPRSTVTVTYSDNTKSIIIVGDDAPQQAGTYVRFGTGDAVYVTDTETVSAFDFGVTDLISLTINSAADSTESSQASAITLSGSAFEKEITLEPSTDENYSASYQMTAPVKRFANEHESSLVTGAIRDLYASSVKYANPSDSQLSQAGLQTPYARLQATYPDCTVELLASKPDTEGNVNLMVAGKNVVYVIAAEKVPWTKTSYEKLCYEYVLLPKMTELTGVEVQANGETYAFKLNTTESTSTDEQGVETTTVNTSCFLDNREIQIGDFTTFYNLITLIQPSDVKADSGSGKQVLSLSYTFSDGSTAKAEYTDTGADTYAVSLNGESAGHAAKAEVTRAINGIDAVTK